ncbi:hypothetical protein ACI6Q2_20660 [Chitinophagaceae bacterium LWZ2-11]
MEDYIINVGEIEELQTIKDIQSLNTIFDRAKRNIVGGGTAVLVRKQLSGRSDKFDELSTLDDLKNYKDKVYKYL